MDCESSVSVTFYLVGAQVNMEIVSIRRARELVTRPIGLDSRSSLPDRGKRNKYLQRRNMYGENRALQCKIICFGILPKIVR